MNIWKDYNDDKLLDEAVLCGDNIRYLRIKFAGLLIEVNKRQLFKRVGFYSIFEFAAKYAGLSHNCVNEILRISTYVAFLPQLSGIFYQQGWSKLRVIAHLATRETDSFWAEKLMSLPKAALEEYAREWKIKNGIMKRKDLRSLVRISFKVKPEVEFKLRKIKQHLHKIRQLPVNFNDLIEYLLDCAKHSGQIRKYNKALTSKHSDIKKRLKNSKNFLPGEKINLNKDIDNEIFLNFDNRCSYFSCNKPNNLFNHNFCYSLHKKYLPDRIASFCENHARLAKAGLIAQDGLDSNNWVITDYPTYENPKYITDKHLIRHYAPG